MDQQQWLTTDNVNDLLLGHGSDRKLRLFACACARRVWFNLGDPLFKSAIETAERFADGVIDRKYLEKTHNALRDVLDEKVADALQDPLDDGAEYTLLDPLAAMHGVDVWQCNPMDGIRHLAHEMAAGTCNYWLTGVEVAEFVAGEAARVTGHVALGAVTAIQPGGESLEAMTAAQTAREAPERRVQADLLRDIFGNPFRPSRVDPAWRTPAVISLANEIYADRTFAALPVLADMLEDAGCDDADLLAHLRGPGPHVRGCFALDLVLGKE